MSPILEPEETTLVAAQKIVAILARPGVDSALIGAVAAGALDRSGSPGR